MSPSTRSARLPPTGNVRAGSAPTRRACCSAAGRGPDRSRALSRAEVEQLLTRQDVSLRERVLWRMLYETACSAEVLALDVEDLDLANRRARVQRKGGAIDIIVWQTGTARLLKGRKSARRSSPSGRPASSSRSRPRRARPRPVVLPARRGAVHEPSAARRCTS
jgi:integrase